MAAAPSLLASEISRRAVDAQNVGIKLTRLAARMTSDDTFITAPYAYEHSEEELTWAADALEEAAKQIRSLTAYTPTGEKRTAVTV